MTPIQKKLPFYEIEPGAIDFNMNSIFAGIGMAILSLSEFSRNFENLAGVIVCTYIIYVLLRFGAYLDINYFILFMHSQLYSLSCDWVIDRNSGWKIGSYD